MPYSIEWSKKSYKQLKGLDKEPAKRVVRKVKELKKFPFEKSKPLSGCDFRRLRIGDYRVILEILPEKRQVKIILLGKRENIYKLLGNMEGRR